MTDRKEKKSGHELRNSDTVLPSKKKMEEIKRHSDVNKTTNVTELTPSPSLQSLSSHGSESSTHTKELRNKSKKFLGRTVGFIKEVKAESDMERLDQGIKSNTLREEAKKNREGAHIRSRSSDMGLLKLFSSSSRSSLTGSRRGSLQPSEVSLKASVESDLRSRTSIESNNSLRSSNSKSQVYDSGKRALHSTKQFAGKALQSEHGQLFLAHTSLLIDEVIQDLKLDDLWSSVKVLWAAILSNEEALIVLIKDLSAVKTVWTSEKFDQFKKNGEILFKRSTLVDEKITREELIKFLKEGISLMKDLKGDQFNPLELLKDGKVLLRTILTSKDSRKTLFQGAIVLHSLKEKNPELFQALTEGESLAKEITKNPEVKSFIKEGQKLVTDMITTEEGQMKIDKDATAQFLKHGATLLNSKDSRQYAEQALINGKEIVERLSQEEHIREMLVNGKKMFKQMKDSGELRELLKSNILFISDLCDSVIPFVRNQLLTMKIPTLGGEKAITGFGKITYEISEIVLSGLTLNSKSVSVDFEEDISVKITNISASIHKLKWKYSQSGFPYLRDSGTGDCRVERAEGLLSFRIEFHDSRPTLTISKSDFKIGHLGLNVGSTSVSMIYNILLSLFSQAIQNQVENEIKRLINKHILKLSTKVNKIAAKYWPKIFSPSVKKKMVDNDSSPSATSSRSNSIDAKSRSNSIDIKTNSLDVTNKISKTNSLDINNKTSSKTNSLDINNNSKTNSMDSKRRSLVDSSSNRNSTESSSSSRSNNNSMIFTSSKAINNKQGSTKSTNISPTESNSSPLSTSPQLSINNDHRTKKKSALFREQEDEKPLDAFQQSGPEPVMLFTSPEPTSSLFKSLNNNTGGTNISESVTDISKPVTDISKPITNISKPVTNISEPVKIALVQSTADKDSDDESFLSSDF